MISRVRRIAIATVVMLGVTLAGLFVSASPAQAACGICYRIKALQGQLTKEIGCDAA